MKFAFRTKEQKCLDKVAESIRDLEVRYEANLVTADYWSSVEPAEEPLSLEFAGAYRRMAEANKGLSDLMRKYLAQRPGR